MTHETSCHTDPDRPVELARPELHVIFGAGQIGTRLAEELLARGHRVRMVRRGQPGRPIPGLEWRRADITDAEATTEATHRLAAQVDTRPDELATAAARRVLERSEW